MPAFTVIEGDVVVRDENGNAVGVILDGAVYRLQTEAKVTNFPAVQPVSDNGGSLTVDGPVTDAQLRATAVPVSATSFPLPAGAATEATLATLLTQATGAAVQAVLEAIRDTTGIKKITDPLPAGTNNIGDVDVMSSALPSGASTEATLATMLTLAGFQARVNTLGQKTMANSTPFVIASDQSAIPTILAAGGTTQKVKITDAGDTLIAGVTADGRLKVDVTAPSAPPSTTATSGEVVSSISASTTTNFIIPSGQTMVVQRFLVGAGGDGGKGARVSLLYDQEGVGATINDLELARVYVQAASFIVSITFTAPRVGNGSDRLRIVRVPMQGSTQEIYGRWEGYY